MTNDVPSGRGFVRLLEVFRASGGTAPADIVGGLLADRYPGEAASLVRLVHSRQLFGFGWRRSLWIPMFQFNADDLSIAAAPQAVRAELPPIWTGWTVATWFAAPNVRLDGHRPVDCLEDDFAAVLQAAQNLPSTEEMAFVPLARAQELAALACDEACARCIAAAGTINTIPVKTLLAYADQGHVGAALSADGACAEAVLDF